MYDMLSNSLIGDGPTKQFIDQTPWSLFGYAATR